MWYHLIREKEVFVKTVTNIKTESKHKMTNLPKLKWRMQYMRTDRGAIPAVAGWYAIGHDECFLDLEERRTYVYIGQTGNLRRRLKQHMPTTEQNQALKKYLSNNIGRARCWYAVAECLTTKKELVAIETKLIARFIPEFNQESNTLIRKKGETT